MSDTFNMPKDFGELCEQYAFHDIKEIYTNGSELIQTYRVEQWIEMNGIEEALKKQAAKQATSNYTSEWIPVSERLPYDGETYLITNAESFEQYHIYKGWYDGIKGVWHMTGNFERKMNVIAWRPLPEPYKENK